MKDVQDLKISEKHVNMYDWCNEFGFVHIVVTDGEKEYTVQACLELNDDGEYINAIESSLFKNGMIDGICGDVNEEFFNDYGIEAGEGYFFMMVNSLMQTKII